VNFLIATIDHRKGKLDEGQLFAEAVPQDATVYLKAQYLLGIIYSDPRYPGDNTRFEKAINAFEQVVTSKLVGQKDDTAGRRSSRSSGEGRVYLRHRPVRQSDAGVREDPPLLEVLGPGAFRERLRAVSE